MKKRVLSALLALCMMLTMAPVAFAGEVKGSTPVTTEEELKAAIANASNGDTITLGADIAMLPIDCGQDVLNPHITISKDLTLNLAGHKIGWNLEGMGSTSYADTPLIFSIDGADVTITGGGTIDSEANNNNSYGINVINNGNLTIENGTFTGAITAVQVTKGSLTILDGTFMQARTCATAVPGYAKYVINCIDSSFKNGTARIYLKGGTYCYDFSKNPEGAGTSYVPVDYTSTQDSNGKTWSVTAKNGMTVAKPENVDSGTVDATVSGVEIPESGSGITTENNTLTVDATVSSSDVTTANITVGGEAISTISESTAVSDMAITTNVGTLTVSEEALATIVSNATTAGTTSDVTLSIENKTQAEDSGTTYELTATDAAGNEVFGEQNAVNGTITVSVPKPSGIDDGSVYVYYLGPDGAEQVEGAKVDGENVVWTVSHFSTYYITATEQGVSVTDENGTTTPYATLQEAIDNADAGDTIKLLTNVTVDVSSGTGASGGAITINKDITLDGGGNTISIGTGFAATGGSGWDADLGKYHVLNILSAATIQNLTIDGGWAGEDEPTDDYSAARSGINIWKTDSPQLQVSLTDVNVNHCSVYAVTAKGADLTITNLTTSGNRWGVNVEDNSDVAIQNSDIKEDIVYESSTEVSTLEITGGTYGTVKTQGSGTQGSVQITEGAKVTKVENGSYTSTNVAVSGSTVETVTNSGSGTLSVMNSTVTGTAPTADSNIIMVGCIDEVGNELNNVIGNTVALYNGVPYTALNDDSGALKAASSNGGTVYLVANADLETVIPAKTTLDVAKNVTLTIAHENLNTLIGSAGNIKVNAGSKLNVGDTKMIGGSDANINLNSGSIELKVGGSAPNYALDLSFAGASAEIPSGKRWTLRLNNAYPMNVTLDNSTTLTVNSNGDGTENDGFRVANDSTLANNGKVVVKGVMSISSEGKVDGSGTIEVGSNGVLVVNKSDSGDSVGALGNAVTNSGIFVWNGTAGTPGKTITLASGGKVYSQADISSKLVNYRTLSDKKYDGTDYTYAWEYYVSSGSSGGGGAATYSVSTSSTTNGTISVSSKSAAKDATVTITVKPNDGYVLDTLTVKDADGNAISVTKVSDTEYTFKMPASKVTISASFTEQTAVSTNPFIDVASSDYYYDAVLWAVENGITNGTSATTFSPNEGVTRAQMVTFLWRAAGSPKATATNPFTDIQSGDYYYDAVLWAVANGVTNGTSATTFSPETAVSRAQSVTFLWRAAGSPVVSGDSFADVAADAYYADAVTWAVENEITNGMSATSFGPDVTASRAQAVTFLYRAAN